LDKSRRSQKETKSTHDKFLQQFHSEKLAINARKEKLTSREVKLKGELEILEIAERKKHEESDNRARKRQDARNYLIKERQASQAEQILTLEQLETQLEDIKERTARTNAERLVLETVPVVSPQQTEMELSPQTSVVQDSSQDMLAHGNESPERANGSPVGGSFRESKD
jgi:sugar-specific transcriptional regulator TrmB